MWIISQYSCFSRKKSMFHEWFRLNTHTHRKGRQDATSSPTTSMAFTGNLVKTAAPDFMAGGVSSSVIGVKRAVPKTFFCYRIILEERFSGALGRFFLGAWSACKKPAEPQRVRSGSADRRASGLIWRSAVSCGQHHVFKSWIFFFPH